MIGIETFGLIGPGFKDRCPELLEDPMTIMASSTAAVGRAQRAGDGWRVSGEWQFVSGIHNAQIFGATVRLYDDDGEEPIDEGNRYAVVPEGEFEIVDTWHVSGMRGSGSHDVRLTDIFVPDSRIIAPLGGHAASTPQLRLPLGNRLAYNKAAVALGIARAGIDAFVDLATRKQPRFTSRPLRDRPFAQRAIAAAEARLIGCRAALMELTAASWEDGVGGPRRGGAGIARCFISSRPMPPVPPSRWWKRCARPLARPRIASASRSNASPATCAWCVSTLPWRRI